MIDSTDEKTFVNSLVKIFLRSGHIFAGLVKEWNEDGVKLININGDETRIPFISDICAVTLKFNKEGKLVRAKKDIENNSIEPKVGDPNSLLAVHKVKSNHELETFREQVMSKDNLPIPQVVHGSQLSIIRSIKDDPKV